MARSGSVVNTYDHAAARAHDAAHVIAKYTSGAIRRDEKTITALAASDAQELATRLESIVKDFGLDTE